MQFREGLQASNFCYLYKYLRFANFLWRFPTIYNPYYHDPNLGFVTKVRAYKGAGGEWSLGITFHALRSVGECEGMNPHIPKLGFPSGSWSPDGLPIF
jgi:hypothetical protein